MKKRIAESKMIQDSPDFREIKLDIGGEADFPELTGRGSSGASGDLKTAPSVGNLKDVPQEDKRNPKIKRMVPLSTLEAERKKFRERLARLQSAEANVNTDAEEADVSEQDSDGTEISDDEPMATSGDTASAGNNNQGKQDDSEESDSGVQGGEGDDPATLEEVLRRLERQERLTQFYELAQQPFYSDILAHREVLEQYTSEHHCTVKEAYNALHAERRYEEVRRNAEQDALANIERKDSRRLEAYNGGDGNGAVRSAVRLTKEQFEAARAYGMSAEEYARYM